MKLICVSPYQADKIRFEVGQEVTDPALIAHLLNDSPESFKQVGPDPAQNKAMKAADVVTKPIAKK